MSSPSVLDGLRNSSKGRLSYKSQLDAVNFTDRRKVLDELTSPTPISPEVIKILSERAHRLSLDSSTSSQHTPTRSKNEQTRGGRLYTPTPTSTYLHTPLQTQHNSVHTPSPLHTPQSIHTPTSEIPQTNQISLSRTRVYRLSDSDDETDDHQGYSPFISVGTKTETSVVEEIHQELEECVESIDDRLMSEMEENLTYRKRLFANELNRIRQEAHDELQNKIRIRQNKIKLEIEKREAMDEQEKIRIDQIVGDLEEQYRTQYEIMKAKLKSGEDQKKEIMRKMADRRRQVMEKLIQQCQEFIAEAKRMDTEFVALVHSCVYPQLLPPSVTTKVRESIMELRTVHSQLVSEVASGHPDQSKVAHLHAKLTGVNPLLSELKTAVQEADRLGEMEAKKQEGILKEAAKKLEEERQAIEEEEKKRKKEKEKPKKENDAKAVSVSDDKLTGLRISTSMLESYSSLHDKLSQTITTCTSLTSAKDPAFKKYRFDLQKAVTGTINSVSSNSGEGLIEKIVHLKRLLSGQSVHVGTKSVSIGNHPDAKLYCCNLLAAKIVKQGEDQVASNTQAAFPLAALAIGVWTDFEDVGDCILAHFYSVCPVLVPMYVSKSTAMSEADYMKSQGYQVSNNGTVESQDLFLNRIRGTVRLYAAIIQTPQLPSGHPTPPHPHGLECGWAWLARMLNMEPHPLVTAAALGDFLEIAGHSLMKKYTVQFKKLLFLLWKEYIPKIERVTQPADRGPLARLTQFLEDCISAGRIPGPKGCLTEQFWKTRSHGIATA